MTLFAGDFAIEVQLFCRSGKRRFIISQDYEIKHLSESHGAGPSSWKSSDK